jgi:hypothetical protein
VLFECLIADDDTVAVLGVSCGGVMCMERSEVVMARIKEDWPPDLPLPEVRFGIPMEPVQWAATFDDELYARAKAALAVVRQGINIDAEEHAPGA